VVLVALLGFSSMEASESSDFEFENKGFTSKWIIAVGRPRKLL
jgi:hypothetical protein